MNLNDKKIIASAYVDGQLDPEEKQWYEEEIKNDQEVLAHIEEIHRLKTFVKQAPQPLPPRPIELYWQRFLAETRELPQSQDLGSVWQKWWAPVATFGLLAVVLIIWQIRSQVPRVKIQTAWSPEPGVVATTFAVNNAQVIWLSSLNYRATTEHIE